MKTNERTILTLIVAAACGFCFGLGQQQVPAQVANCQSSCCEPLYAWWVDGTPGGKQCMSAQFAGATWPFAAGDNTTTAIVSVYLPARTPGGCKLDPAGTYDRWTWPSNLAACSAVGGLFPSPQSVTPSAPPPKLSMAGAPRNICIIPVVAIDDPDVSTTY